MKHQLTIAAISLTMSIVTAAAAQAAKPNILLILVDDLGYGDVSCYNPESKIGTPNVDHLSAGGMRFTDAHSPSSVCTPTRYSIMTGQMAFRLNYRWVFTGVEGPCLIAKDRLTLPGMLRDHGYETAMFGKWHIGMTFFDKDGKTLNKGGLEGVKRVDYSRAIPDAPVHRGFDHFFGTDSCPTTDWLYAFVDGDRIPVPPTRILDRSKLPDHPLSFDCREGMVAPDFDHEEVDMLFLDKSLKFLDSHVKEHPDKPFFLFHSMQAVHLPSFPGKDFKGRTKAGPHGDFILEMDTVVGRLMDKIKSLGLDDNTLVILTSDNGPEVETVLHMRSSFHHDGARPWRGLKRDNWEGGHRVPFIVRWPGNVKAGSIAKQTVCLTDIMSTCAAVVDAELPDDSAEDSFNILPVLLGKTRDEVRQYTLHQTPTLALAIRRGKWKYLDHQGSGGNDYRRDELAALNLPDAAPAAPGQLYDLEADPGETTNLYFEHPETVKELKALLDETKRSGRSAPMRE